MERQMLIVSNLIRNADRAPDHTVIQFRSAFEETYEEWIWITLYNLGFDSPSHLLSSRCFPSQLEMKNNIYCWFMLVTWNKWHIWGEVQRELYKSNLNKNILTNRFLIIFQNWFLNVCWEGRQRYVKNEWWTKRLHIHGIIFRCFFLSKEIHREIKPD